MTATIPNPDVTTKLDRPIWTALTSSHAHLAAGATGVLRYKPGVVPFIGFGRDDRGDADGAASLFGPGEQLVTLQRPVPPSPLGLRIVTRADAVQLIAAAAMPRHEDARIVPLGRDDLDDMLALAALTRPGPFTREILRLGNFAGIRIGGRLAAMAGQRWRQPGFTEMSGVCTHPDFQRRGLARTLSCHVAGLISGRGDRPYLHAYASNASAIDLYRSIGFEIRAAMHVAVYERAG